MAEYQLTHSTTVIRTSDGAFLPDDPANADFQRYTQWLADGGVPDPPAPPSRAGVISQSAQSRSFSDARSLNAQGRTQEAIAAILDLMEPRT
jgi:hypothetical protein